jgi:hypothetical protein
MSSRPYSIPTASDPRSAYRNTLSTKVARLGDVGLIIIDPIMAYLGAGRINRHRAADVRAVLSPDFAEERHVEVLGLTHPAKTVTRTMNAAQGRRPS